MVGWTHSATLGETAHFGAVLFQLLTGLMLALFLFFSALSAASSVAREKDRRTFVLLLMTDLRNSEIVLGKILGSLLPIWLLLATTVPLLMLLMLLGGVGVQQVIQAVLVAAADVAGGRVARRAGGAVARPHLSVAGADGAAGGVLPLPGAGRRAAAGADPGPGRPAGAGVARPVRGAAAGPRSRSPPGFCRPTASSA